MTKGLMGECPDEYPLFKAAQYCNCTPWELLEVSVYWRDKALKYQTAEAEAQEFLSKHPT